MSITNTDNCYVANTYKRFPIEIASGEGSVWYDTDGKRYIDMGGGIAVNIFGASDKAWVAAVTEQLSKIQHTSNLYYTGPGAELAKRLCERTGMKKVFFSNSGAEANECAIKAARRYSYKKYGEGRHNVITLKNSFHGRTITTLAATGQDSFHTDFGPFTEGFLYASASDITELEALLMRGDIAAIMMETVQGEGGVYALESDYVAAAVKLAEENDILVIIDEVQTGNGRTGKLYSYMNYGITPDIVSTAKGLAGGLPLGATMLGEKVENVFDFGSHGSTFGANPVCCAAAINVLDRIDDKLLEGVEQRSQIIKEKLSGASGVKSISGKGLMLGIESEKPAGEVVAQCLKNGVLVLTAKTKVRLLPPLNIDTELLWEALEVLKDALATK